MSNLARLALSAGYRQLVLSSLRQSQIISTRSCKYHHPLNVLVIYGLLFQGGWVEHWKPGPYPKTKEEREAAARKYNLIPEDYVPFEEGSPFGDYPNLPAVGQDVRDPYEIYDSYYRRRNFAETLHVDYDIHTSDKMNPNIKHRYPMWVMVLVFLASFGSFAVIGWIDRYLDLHTGNPIKPKQYPADGKHYTFEPLD